MKNIYIVLMSTGTMTAKLIKAATKAKYQHVSISLNKDLSEMYSFGRRRARNPFTGSMVKEPLDGDFFRRFNQTFAKIIEVKVSNEDYNKIKNEIYSMYNDTKRWKFNYVGMFCAGAGINLKRKHKYYCSQFVGDILKIIDMNLSDSTIKPIDFETVNGVTIYEGPISKYKVQ